VLGHVDSAKNGAGVFFKLGAAKNGDRISVTRADGSVVSFTVYAVREYSKDAFPSQTVYGNTSGPELRLITCGGRFDGATGHYLSNIVVFARATPS
ncbi:MAG: sortase domain-containing protein, partial [Acidothermaceae bacterium]